MQNYYCVEQAYIGMAIKLDVAKFKEALAEWEKNYTIYLHYIREMRSNEYNVGYADGVETAIVTLKKELEKLNLEG